MPEDQLGALRSYLQSVQGERKEERERERERLISNRSIQSSITYIRGKVLVDNGIS